MPELRYDKQIAATPGMGRVAVHEKASNGWSRETHDITAQLQRRTGSRQTGNRARLPLRVPSVVEREEFAVLRPDMLLPFSVGKQKARNRFAGRRKLRPDDFKNPSAETLNGSVARLYLRRANLRLFGRALRALYRNRNGQRKPETPQNADLFRLGRLSKSFNDFAVNATDVVPPDT
ncbi:MAG: hypothetical protein ACLRSW_09935 [Christensenellaceae bacterium]